MYNNFTDTDYYASPRSVTFRPGANETSVIIRTRQDSVLEAKYESFDIIANYPLKPNGTCALCAEASFTIEDDDGTYVFNNVRVYTYVIIWV